MQIIQKECDIMPKKKIAADAASSKQNENFVYLFMIVLLAEIVAVGLLHGVQKYYSYLEYMSVIQTAAGWVALGAAVLGVIGLAAFIATGKRVPAWIGSLLLLTAACAGCAHLLYTEGVTMAYALVIGAGVLYLAGKIYPPEFVMLGGVSGLAAVCYYGISKYGGTTVWNSYTMPLVVALAVVLAVVLVLVALAGRNNGLLKLGAAKLQLWQKQSAQILLYLACVVWAALLALIFLLGATFAWYCVLVAALAIFVLAVWFTIKLM